MDEKKKGVFGEEPGEAIVPGIDPVKLDQEVPEQVQGYFALPFHKTFRGQVILVFALAILLAVGPSLISDSTSMGLWSILMLFFVDCVVVWKGNKIALYLLMPIALVAPWVFLTSIMTVHLRQHGSPSEIIFIAFVIVMMFVLYRAVRVEELREKIRRTPIQ
jgi:hypothetical protein